MTEFELLAKKLGVPIRFDAHGFYTGKTRELACICCDVIMDADGVVDITEEVTKRYHAKYPSAKKS